MLCISNLFLNNSGLSPSLVYFPIPITHMQTFIVHSLKKLFWLLVLLGFILPLFRAFLIIVRLNDCWKRHLTTGRDSRTYGHLLFYHAKAGQFAISIRGTYFSELSVAFEKRSSQPDNLQGCCFNYRHLPLRVV